ncbi:hypothetical protein ACK33D_09360 [Aeromonas hydrophila]|uniref:hypothetical protein n=1 Tax=Aeromonas hydrophila TaxID=644 RepID=UPI0039865966
MSKFKYGISVESDDNGCTYSVYRRGGFIKKLSSQEAANSYAEGLEKAVLDELNQKKKAMDFGSLDY